MLPSAVDGERRPPSKGTRKNKCCGSRAGSAAFTRADPRHTPHLFLRDPQAERVWVNFTFCLYFATNLVHRHAACRCRVPGFPIPAGACRFAVVCSASPSPLIGRIANATRETHPPGFQPIARELAASLAARPRPRPRPKARAFGNVRRDLRPRGYRPAPPAERRTPARHAFGRPRTQSRATPAMAGSSAGPWPARGTAAGDLCIAHVVPVPCITAGSGRSGHRDALTNDKKRDVP